MTATINERQIIHQGRVFKLVRENVTLKNGVTTDMEYVEHPGATAIIPMLTDSRILLLRQYRHALRKHIWEIPAGTLDPSESILDCAKKRIDRGDRLLSRTVAKTSRIDAGPRIFH